MALLHLVPHLLLFAVALWLLWPMIADPIRRRAQSQFHRDVESPDDMVDDLIGVWTEQGKAAKLSRPLI